MTSFLKLTQDLQDSISALDKIIDGAESEEVVRPDGQVKSTLEKRISNHFQEIRALLNGQESYETKSALDADLSPDHGTSARVWNDASKSNNGLYEKLGAAGTGSWQKSQYDNYDEFKQAVLDLQKVVNDTNNKYFHGLQLQGIEAADRDIAVHSGQYIELDEQIDAFFSDENGYSPLMLTKLGEVIIPLLRSYGLRVKDDLIDSMEANYDLSVHDENGNVAFGVESSSNETHASGLKVFKKLKLGDSVEILHGEFNYDLSVVDDFGNVVLGVFNGVPVFADSRENFAYSSRDQINIAQSNQLKQAINTASARHEFEYNHIVVYGQSLSTGHEGWPALSKTNHYGNLMLGGSVRPQSTDGDQFNGFGGNTLQPLVANVQQGSTILTDEEVALLTPGNGSLGETVNFGLVNFAKKLFNRDLNTANDSRVFITTNCGVSGKTIEQLSKNNTQDATNRYGRFHDAVTAVKTESDSAGKTSGVTGIVWMQGEWNYRPDKGGDTTYTGYKALLKQLRDDQVADIQSVYGQVDAPAFITYQTGVGYTVDEDGNGEQGLAIGMAQWDFTKENENCFLAGPVYPYTDKGGHLDSNGYRWYGNLLGKVYHKIVTLGQDWKPLSPIKTELVGQDVYIDFHVPEPPLKFDVPYVNNESLNYVSKGFRVTDEAGENAVSGAEIVGATIVKLSLRRPITGAAHVWYADKTKHLGNGCLRDSDSITAHDLYEYMPNSGMYESANIPELVNKPYPMHNWCIAFHVPVNWEDK